jgi:protein-tyrosine phosphatase
MIDLHCHILPGVDDGPDTLDESLAMARFKAADGITHVVATPHCHRTCRLLRADILPHVAWLNAALAAEKVPLAVLPGAEIQAYDTRQYRQDYEAGLYCHLGDRPAFTLLEFPWRREMYPADAADLVGWLRERGTTPIVAHPERHAHFTDNPNWLRALVEAGAWLQVTADSLLGNHGPAARAAVEVVLRAYPGCVLSTDAHNLRRCSGLSAGYAWVREHLGADREADLRERGNRVLAAVT